MCYISRTPRVSSSEERIVLIGIVQAALPSNTFVVYGEGQEKELTDLVPEILPQLGADSLNSLRKLAESFQAQQAKLGKKGEDDDEDDDIPELVEGESFESKVE
jgi:nascent polypeptide-associated complex subunit beta